MKNKITTGIMESTKDSLAFQIKNLTKIAEITNDQDVKASLLKRKDVLKKKLKEKK